jgi:ABC-type Mn2+/Zn2+ transport system permease subunit
VNTLRNLSDPSFASIFWPGVIAAIAIALLCSILSPLVVLKRLSFVGQGISHAAFGGIGLSLLLGAVGATVATTAAGQFSIVLVFCLACALLIAYLSERGASHADTIIGIVLVGAMTLGAILTQLSSILAHGTSRPGAVPWESILFGSITLVGWPGAAIAWAVALTVVFAILATRRELYFWAFDEPAAPAFGVRAHLMKLLLVLLLTLAIVTSMKLAGVVLSTALLILPGAAALNLSDRLTRVIGLSIGMCLVGVCTGLVLSFEILNGYALPPGAAIVAVLVLFYAVARVLRALAEQRSRTSFAPR